MAYGTQNWCSAWLKALQQSVILYNGHLSGLIETFRKWCLHFIGTCEFIHTVKHWKEFSFLLKGHCCLKNMFVEKLVGIKYAHTFSKKFYGLYIGLL